MLNDDGGYRKQKWENGNYLCVWGHNIAYTMDQKYTVPELIKKIITGKASITLWLLNFNYGLCCVLILCGISFCDFSFWISFKISRNYIISSTCRMHAMETKCHAEKNNTNYIHMHNNKSANEKDPWQFNGKIHLIQSNKNFSHFPIRISILLLGALFQALRYMFGPEKFCVGRI